MTWASTVVATVDACAGVIEPYVDRDWTTTMAYELDWSVWDTVVHVNDDLYFYAGQLLLADPVDYHCFELKADDHADPARLLAALRMNGRLLAAAHPAAASDTVAFHAYGPSDPDGFAAMGVVETLVHTYDVIRGLDPASSWRPPDELAAPALARLFPDADGTNPPGAELLHVCGRIPLGERPRLADWRWDSSPRP